MISPLIYFRDHESIILDPSQYDFLEIHGVCQVGDHCEVCDENPEFFSVYVHLTAGGVECVGDFSLHSDAVKYAGELSQIYGWQFADHSQPVHQFTDTPSN